MNREFSPEVVAELRDALTQMARLDRRTRRALVRHHRKVTR